MREGSSSKAEKPKKGKPKKEDRVRIIGTTWTGEVVENIRGDELPYLVELDEATMKKLPPALYRHFEATYYGPCTAEELKVDNWVPDTRIMV